MQILYVSIMVAIFVLCLALLSTARRILQSTPLTSGQLSISKSYDLDGAQAEALASMKSGPDAIPAVESAYSAPDVVLSEPPLTKAVVVDVALPQVIQAKTMNAEPLFAAPLPSLAQTSRPIPMPKKSANLLPPKKGMRMRKPSRRAYNYAFECLLLGVSAVVLIKTQRGIMRYRATDPRTA